MGYERNDRRYFSPGYGPSHGEDRDRGYGYGPNRQPRGDYRGNDYRSEQGRYGSQRDYRGDRFDDRDDQSRISRDHDQDRGFFDRAGDEVRSWFGDDDAERRRRDDDRRAGYGSDRGFSSYGGGWATEFGIGDPYAYGADTGYGYGAGSYGNRATSDHGRRREPAAQHDHGYQSWRDRQMSAFDRDYDEYRREHQSKFDSEFASWRQNRQSQREQLSKVQEHQEVVGSDGQHIGTVDHVRGDRIRLTKNDGDAQGHHHSIPCAWIQSVDDKVSLSKTADQAKQFWRDEQREEGGFFGRENSADRSFSGTY